MKIQSKVNISFKKGSKYPIEHVMLLPSEYQKDFFRKPTFIEDGVYPYTDDENDTSDFDVCTKSIRFSAKIYHN